MTAYYRPIPQTGPSRPENALTLAGGWTWFTHAERLERGSSSRIVPANDLPSEVLTRLTSVRPDISGIDFSEPRVMGILNVTPDSFSDGGKHFGIEDARKGALAMQGCDLLDIGGESTRPGAQVVPDDEEVLRTAPVIMAIRASGIKTPISIDTRKSAAAKAALEVGANIVNDVSGFTYDPRLASLCASENAPVCVMHAQGDPATMQDNPHYGDVLLDVYDFLNTQIETLATQGIPREKIIADPGIGFGKTVAHNLALLSRLSLFHTLGVPILLGASRKRFIGTVAKEDAATSRLPGSLAVALAGLKHGTQIVRVHDVPETLQAIALWQAVMAGQAHG